MDAALAGRAAADPARFHDVVYEALVADPSLRWSAYTAGWAWSCPVPRGGA
jgi:hypothetical protein